MSQVVQANKKCCTALFWVRDLVYLSTKNLVILKGHACKLLPKFLGPFVITDKITEGVMY